ncbi:hypothetical protein Btru_004293 [Bulinus truncatus]|nr:hypothetical protein Btru_004293 [Bulinus truncatus]
MAYEMGIMSDLQLFSTPALVATLAWDATTIDGCHFNEINLSFSDKTYTLEIGKLAGGATKDHTQHIDSSLRNMATLYSTFTQLEEELVLHKFQSIFHTTLTNRAPVNNCVSDKLSQIFCIPLLKLHCCLHPLDGLATEAKKILKRIDQKYELNSQVFGTEGSAAYVVYAVSKLRYKMKAGDPAGFKHFLKLSNVSPGIIPRYVGNRLNILFHSAGVVVLLRDVLQMFLEKYCKESTFRLAVLNDLQKPLIITQLRVLGYFSSVNRKHELCLSLFERAEHFLGRTLYHTWETEESDEVFTGTVINVQDDVLTLKYYGEKKTTKLSLYAIIVDVMLGDIVFTQ